MRLGMKSWTKRNGLPSMPNSDISDLCQYLWSEHSKQVTCIHLPHHQVLHSSVPNNF
jgi:hypothetical protein